MTSGDLKSLREAFSGRLLTTPDDMAPFLTDWRRLWHGQARAVVQPDTSADVAAILRWAYQAGVAVTPQGGNTGLSGGSVPEPQGDGIVLSLARLNKIRAVDPINSTITAEAGCVLAEIQNAAEKAERLFPLSLAAEGSCTIGGNLATNAGGTGVLRYGNARELCLGLEVVTAQGDLWDGLRGLRKDNTGYDLRDLFIGSEGTLGVITAAVLKLHPLPAARITAFAAVKTPADATTLLHTTQKKLGASLTAFELISAPCLNLVLRHHRGFRHPLENRSSWYVLLEVSDPRSEERAIEGLQDTLMEALEHDVIDDVAIASSIAQSKDLWSLREYISEAQSQEGKVIKHDVAVPISRIATFIEEAFSALAANNFNGLPLVFGHLGDGNIHFNIQEAKDMCDDEFRSRQTAINRVIHDLVAAHQGSISAEHGLGVLRRDEAARYKSPVEIGLMRAIKAALDPTSIMNPGKLL